MRKACDKRVTACLSCQQVKDPRKWRFPLQSIEPSQFNEVVQIDHQKICMTVSGYNQFLVMIDHFTKYAEAVPCITASAEETFESPSQYVDSATRMLNDISTEQWNSLRRRTYERAHENGLVERQNWTAVSMLRVYCSRYRTDWDKYLPQVMGYYNSTQHSTT